MKQLKLAVCIIAGLFMFTVGKSQTKDLFPTWKWVIKAQFEVAGSFYEGLAAIKKDGKWGFIDKIGAIVIQPEFDGVKNFSDGMAAVKKDGKWGYINRTGEIVISPVYHDAYNFREDIARVERFEKDEDYYINRNGHNTPVLPIKHKSKKLTPRPENNSAAFPSVRNGKYGFIDKNKNWVIPPQFIGAKEFADSMACVNQNGKWGFIRLLSPFEYVNEYIKSKIQTSQHADIGVEIITLFDKAIEDFVESSLFAMEFTLSDISDYDEVNNTFLISIHAFGKLVLKVEKEDARALRYNWSRVKFSEPVFTVARNIETGKPQIILTKIDIINPINKKIHTWSSHDRLDYKNVSQEETFEYIGMSEAFKDVFLQTGEPEIIEPEQETKNIEVKPETENIEPEQEKKNIEAKPETENIEPEQEKKNIEAKSETENIEPEQEKKNIEAKPETENIEPEQEKKNIEAKPETENIEPEQEKKNIEAKSETENIEPEQEKKNIEAKSETENIEPEQEKKNIETKSETENTND